METTLHYLSRVRGLVACKHLWLTHYAGLSPAVLRALARPLDGADGAEGRDIETWMCPNVASLRILGAPLVGSADVRAVLEVPLAHRAASGVAHNIYPGYVVSSVEDLYVRDCGPLAPEDRQWVKLQ